MIPKFSVRRPYTIVVAVVLVIVLGVVSFMNMKTDLLPSMNLPYMVVVTTYIGATPEKVENSVTRPIEQAISSTAGVEAVSSTSSENSSVVIVQFADGTNMDSALLELSGNIDMVKGQLDDGVGDPSIIRINPDMLPVLIATVDRDGMTRAELSSFVSNELMPQLEGIEGVGSVSVSGILEESYRICLNQDKIDVLNDRILVAVDEKLLEARDQLDEAEKELADGRAELENQSGDNTEKLAQGAIELADGKQEILSGIKQLEDGVAMLETQYETIRTTLRDFASTREGYLQLSDGIKQVNDGLMQLANAEADLIAGHGIVGISMALGDAENIMNDQIDQFADHVEDARAELDDLYLRLDAAQNDVQRAELTKKIEQQKALVEVYDNALFQAQIGATQITNVLGGLHDAAQQIKDGQILITTQRDQLLVTLAQLNITKETTDTQLRAQYEQLVATYEQLSGETYVKPETPESLSTGEDLLTPLHDVMTKLVPYIEEQLFETLPKTRRELENALAQVNDGQVELTQGQIALTQELTKAAIMLEQGEKELEKARDEFEKQSRQAYEQAGLDGALSLTTVSQLLFAQNFAMPAGYIDSIDGHSRMLKVGDAFVESEQLEALMLFDTGKDVIGPVYLIDVADVIAVNNAEKLYTRIGKNDGIMVQFQKQSTYATSEVSDAIAAQFDRLEENYDGLHLTVMQDQGIYIDMVISTVLENLASGGILAILILLLFLMDWRPTLIVSFSIPISLMFAIVLMYFTDISLNMLSLGGLALGVGMLVDNSIVVIENTYRLRQNGESAISASVHGANQVGSAIVSSTLTTVCVFVPILFIHGMLRDLFGDMGLTIAYALVASLIVATTLVPMMCAFVLRKIPARKRNDERFGRFAAGYEKSLNFILHHKFIALGLSIVLMIGSIFIVVQNGMILIPPMEGEQLTITLTPNEGDTQTQTRELSEQILDRLLRLSDIDTIGAMEGSSALSMGGGGAGSISMYVILNDKARSMDEIKADITALTADLDCTLSVSSVAMDMSLLTGSGLEIDIAGPDTQELMRIAQDMADLLTETEGTAEVDSGINRSEDSVTVTVDKNEAMTYGLTTAQVYQAIATELTNEATATTLTVGTQEYPVVVVRAQQPLTDATLGSLTLDGTKDGETVQVPLRDIAQIGSEPALMSIARENQTRTLTASAKIADGYNIALVSRQVQEKLDAYDVPDGYSIKIVGENESINEAMSDLLLMIFLAVIFIYLIMVAQFQSLLSPFIVLFTIPLAFTGGLIALILCRMELSMIAMLGLLMLAGIIVNNGIVLVDYINQLRLGGREKHEAILEAGRTRLRPILMTALTTILGLFTMALGIGAGGSTIQPMAVVTVGGLIYATFMTLYVVPCLYDLFQRKDMTARAQAEHEALEA